MTELDLGPHGDLEDGRPTLRRAGDQRFVCVRRGESVDVLDDRCPHEGYPLSQGTCSKGVLTCEWHNWKFDLESGDNLFGGEPVRRYPVRIESGRVFVDTSLDVAAERERITKSVCDGQRNGSIVVRDGLRLAALSEDGSLKEAFGVLALDAADRAPWGMDHGMAMLADVVEQADRGLLEGEPAFAATSALMAEPLVHADRRAASEPRSGRAGELGAMLDEDRYEDAEALTRHLVRSGQSEALLRDGIVPWLAKDLAGYGHGVIFTMKAAELAARFEAHAEEIWVSLVLSHAYATIESALPGWRPTHRALRDVTLGRSTDAAWDRNGYVDAVLGSESSAVAASLEQLAEGRSPDVLLRACARAAAIRVARFDDAWESRIDAPVTILNVSHALTFAESALAMPTAAPFQARFAIQAAGFVGKLHRSDAGPRTTAPDMRTELSAALETRSLDAALHSVEQDNFYEALAPFALYDAFVRPIFVAHSVKTTEACRRLELGDPDGAPLYRAAALTLAVPRRPERFPQRTATIASRFLEDGKPPPRLF